MAITRKPAQPVHPPQDNGDAAAEKFISGAPDALASHPGTSPEVRRKKRPAKGSGKVQFGFTANRDLEKQIDDWCEETGMNITTLVTLALKEYFGRNKKREN